MVFYLGFQKLFLFFVFDYAEDKCLKFLQKLGIKLVYFPDNYFILHFTFQTDLFGAPKFNEVSQKLAEVYFLAFEYYGEIEGTKKLLEVLNRDIPFSSSINSLKNHSRSKALVRDPFGFRHSSDFMNKELANQRSQNIWVRLWSCRQTSRGLLDIMIVVMEQLFPHQWLFLGFGISIIIFASS